MPVFEFICTNKDCCVSKISVVQRMNDVHKANCPNCGKPARRIFGNIQETIFKGEGFTKSADAKEEEDVWKDRNRSYFTPGPKFDKDGAQLPDEVY